MRRGLAVLLGVLLAPGLIGCSSGAATDGALPVVTSTTVFADLVARVGGEDVSVSSLVPKGGVVETFDPSPGDIARVSGASLLFINGLGLDDWAVRLARDADVPRDRIVELATNLPGVEYLPGEAQAPGSVNPHLWLNVAYAAKYVARITEQLAAADPAHASAFRARGGEYREQLRSLDGWARDQLSSIPSVDRKIVSFHDALPYFASAYGLEIAGVVVEAPGQDPSAGEIAGLIATIRDTGVKAIVSEVQFPADLVRTIAAETGAVVVADLYNDSLGDPPIDSYQALIRYDVERLVGALR